MKSFIKLRPGVMGSLLGLTNLSDETSGAVALSPNDLSYWWDI